MKKETPFSVSFFSTSGQISYVRGSLSGVSLVKAMPVAPSRRGAVRGCSAAGLTSVGLTGRSGEINFGSGLGNPSNNASKSAASRVSFSIRSSLISINLCL